MLIAAGPALAEGGNGSAGADWDHLATPLFTHLNRTQGLPPDIITSIARDADGFIWIGTDAGLARWDGYGTRLFWHDDGDPDSLPGSIIRGLLTDASGVLWVLTPEGAVTRYDHETGRFQTFPSDPAGLGEAIGFASDGKGGIWVDGKDGLAELDPASGGWTRAPIAEVGLPTTYNRGIAHGHDGSLWLARGDRIGRLHDGHFELITLPITAGAMPKAGWTVSTIVESADHAIWYGTYGGQVGRLDPETLTARLAPEAAAPGSPVFAITELADGRICFGFAGGGVSIFRPENRETVRLSHADGLADDDVRALSIDPSGVMFIGGARGVDLYAPDGRAVMTLLPGPRGSRMLSGQDVTSILPRPNGDIWFSLRTGTIDEFSADAGRVRSLRLPTSARHIDLPRKLYTLAAKPNGSVLAASTNGLSEITPDGGDIRSLDGNARGGTDVVISATGTWLGTSDDGLESVDDAGRVLAAFSHDPAKPDSLISAVVNTVLPADDRLLWVGTSEGLDLLDPASGRARHFLHDDRDALSLPAPAVWALLRDRRGRLWVGTGGNGIGILDAMPAAGSPRFHHIGRVEGLPHANVETLIEDGAGKVWAATDDGLAEIDPDTLKVVHSLNESDGQVVANYWEGSAARLANGTLMFGGQNGVSIVHPARLEDWSYRPPIRVTDIKVGNRDLPVWAPIVASPWERRIEVGFTALDYSAPERNRYAYRLEGYDTDWITASAGRRVASYQNLPPGDYRLLLRGSNRAGVWSDPPLAVPITILPAPHQTLWFQAAEVLLAGALVFGLVHLRTGSLRRRRALLEAEVAARTEELAKAAETLRIANIGLEHLAQFDPLTDLGNRRRFFQAAADLLAQARRYNRPCSVLMVDLDHFKRINDRFGHAAGDETLRVAASCLIANLRDTDVAARLGGEELAVLMPETDLAGAWRVAERFRAALEATAIPFEGNDISVTASVGVATWSGGEADIQPALERADAALYRVKSGGRNAVACEPPLPDADKKADR